MPELCLSHPCTPAWTHLLLLILGPGQEEGLAELAAGGTAAGRGEELPLSCSCGVCQLQGGSVPPPRAQEPQAKPFSMKPGSGCCVPLEQGVQALSCAARVFQTRSQLQSCSHSPFSPPSSQSGVSDVSGVLCLGHPVLLLHLPLCPCASGIRGHQQRAVASAVTL